MRHNFSENINYRISISDILGDIFDNSPLKVAENWNMLMVLLVIKTILTFLAYIERHTS